jgi:hypothetical protein
MPRLHLGCVQFGGKVSATIPKKALKFKKSAEITLSNMTTLQASGTGASVSKKLDVL